MSTTEPNDFEETHEAPVDDLFRAAPEPVTLLRDVDDDEAPAVMSGHFAVFDEWTEIDSFFEGRFMERIAPGAFTKTMTENRANMKVLFQHGRDPMVGDKPLGPIVDLEEDKRGARYDVSLLDTSYNRDLIPGLEAGQYGSSFRFKVVRDDWNREPAKSRANPEKLPERTLLELRVMEFGPVTFPAYAGANAGMRSLTDKFVLERQLAGDVIEMLEERVEAALRERIAHAPSFGSAASTTASTPGRRPTSRGTITTLRRKAPPWRLP